MDSKIKDILDIVNASEWTTGQKHHILSNIAERLISCKESMNFTDEEMEYMDKMYYDDLNEGNTPYKPRYILPDYVKFMKQGSKFLGIKSPTNLDEAIDALEILYAHVPSVTSYPVYIGQLDELLEPFIKDTEDDYIKVDRFLNHIDKTIPDSFCHANIGPRDTIVGRMILRSCIEHPSPTPNISMKVDTDKTPLDFLAYAMKASLKSAKPAYANHKLYSSETHDYAIVSCYNSLQIGGGGSTLPRLKFLAPVNDSKNSKEYMEKYLPKAVDIFLSILNKRHTYIMNSRFFKDDFLVKEGLLFANKFIGMFGIIGLGTAVDTLMKKDGINSKMGYGEQANKLATQIMDYTDKRLKDYNKKNNTNFKIHAQVGANLQSIDEGMSLATRVSVDTKMDIFDHLKHIGAYQKYCLAGTGEHFAFDPLWESRTDKLASIINTGLKIPGTRYIGVYGQESDYIRVTGYLVKRSEVDKFENDVATLRDTASMGSGTNKNTNVFNRKTHRPLDKLVINVKNK